MASYFFRVEHDLLRSDAFRSLGGSAIKVYLVIGLFSDFGTDWGYPSTRTIARQAGLSRQTVIDAIQELIGAGFLIANKSRGKSTAYRVLRQPAPDHRPTGDRAKPVASKKTKPAPQTGRDLLDVPGETGPKSLVDPSKSGLFSLVDPVQKLDHGGREDGPKRETGTKEDTASAPIPGTPFRLSADGRLLVAVDLQELLTNQGLPENLATRLVMQKDPEAVAKVLLNAFYLQSLGKLQNGPGYIRAGIEDGYDLLPQVANRLETRRRELAERLRKIEQEKKQARAVDSLASQEAAVSYVLENLHPDELKRLTAIALDSLPEPVVRRNPTLSNPFVRGKVYELACGEPVE
ncbi:helix-turn-helix domain-containing protein [Paludisphaera mucosa]|uniref:Helix-turn-helix domain-containing protein n=1 Tax=Paludisphaera mucosa TaxID=3030827 RepID=A0ABT6FBS2_9BACT|nr:helix-turn-helix domain-containing protein [Paludisphaera mucosa]MDG3004828.1 helix-turn-helix domain-containing protein [Paludisphaera mucosa]